MRRRLLLFFAAVSAVVVLALLTLPWWLGVALRAAPDSAGLTFGAYERVGYARFALRDVEFRRGSVRVTATRVEADTPVRWLWRRSTGKVNEVVAERWLVEVLPNTAAAPSTEPQRESGWVPLRTTLRRVAAQLDKWLPRAKTGEGVVRWKNGQLSIAAATWSERTLSVQGFVLKAVSANITAAFPSDADEIRLSAQTTDDEAGRVALSSRGAEVVGDVLWWNQAASFTGRFAERGWLPTQAVLDAPELNLPAARVKLGDSYARLIGRARIDWSDQHFQADVKAKGEPAPGKKAPELEVDLRARGDLQVFTIESLRAVLPGIAANLTEPVTLDRSGKIREGAARFLVRAELEQQPWFEADGVVNGEAKVISDVGRSPRVDFQFEANDVAAHGVAISRADVTGQFAWPRIEISAGAITGGNGERLTWRGGWDFKAKEILPATVQGQFRRATLARWLPTRPEFDAITLAAEASGGVMELRHRGEAKADNVLFKGAKPLGVSLAWNGRGTAIDKFTAEVSAPAARVSASGSVGRDSLQLETLELFQSQELRLKLTSPARVQWKPVLQIESLHLAGPSGTIDAELTWGETGRVQFAARNVASHWLKDFVALRGPEWQVTSAAVTGSWDRGPMTFSAVLGAAIELGEGRRAGLNLAGRGDQRGIRLEALRASEGADSIIHATGNVPIVFTPGAANLMTIDHEAALELDAETAPNAVFWQELAALTGLELKEPSASAHVRGTWRRPRGDVRLQAARIAVDPKRFKRPLPTIEMLDVALVGAPDGVQLEKFSLHVEGQAIAATGKLPVAEADWSAVFKEPMAFARRGADLRVEIPDADLAAFGRFLPSVLAPKGRVHLDVAYRGGEMNGNLRLSDAATRPLGPLGVLQQIEADIRLAGEALELRSVKATSGGEEVSLTGRVELPMLRLPAGASPQEKEPRFQVALKGDNLPFVRKTGLLVRGDLDLQLNTTEGGGERVSGTVRLRDSLFLQDVRALLPRGGASSRARRPPYFSVENPPLNAWRLDVKVEGEQFMRLRTTVFNGIASARFHLGGTLEEPIAIGDIVIDEGRVRLPFASFEVQEGRVMLTREQPFDPQIWVAAETRRYGYDLRMEITGGAAAPVLAFSSSPPLEHGQVLLMVMAGEAPKQEVTYTDQQRARKLGTYLGQSLLASFGDSEGGDRLIISTGEKISEQGRETLDIEYQLNDRWSITGEYDEYDDYNAGVKWRVYTREGDREKAKDEAR